MHSIVYGWMAYEQYCVRMDDVYEQYCVRLDGV